MSSSNFCKSSAGAVLILPKCNWVAATRHRQTTTVDVEIRRDEKASPLPDAVRSQVIDALETQEIKETGNEEV
jgi:hypothetical protein